MVKLRQAGKLSLWSYLMAVCAIVLLSRPGSSVWPGATEPGIKSFVSAVTTPNGFFLLAMVPLVALTLWELHDLDRRFAQEEYGELVG